MGYYWSYEMTFGRVYICEENNEIVLISQEKKIPLESVKKKETELIKKAACQLEEYLDGKRKKFELPLNPKGTKFQKLVWDALLKIPYGETRCYKDVAKFVLNPKGARAIGMANNRNPIMIVIPCHRVIGKNGALVGYAGGLGLKEKLLKLEKEFSAKD